MGLFNIYIKFKYILSTLMEPAWDALSPMFGSLEMVQAPKHVSRQMGDPITYSKAGKKVPLTTIGNPYSSLHWWMTLLTFLYRNNTFSLIGCSVARNATIGFPSFLNVLLGKKKQSVVPWWIFQSRHLQLDTLTVRRYWQQQMMNFPKNCCWKCHHNNLLLTTVRLNKW